MRHRDQFPVDHDCTITAVRCNRCWTSFDATASRSCAGCGQIHDADLRDWVVQDITW